jgi:zinc protease
MAAAGVVAAVVDASPPPELIRLLPPPPPAPRPLPPAAQTLASAPPLLGPYTLGNGLRLFLIEDHEAPLVRGTLLLKGGSRGVPPEKLGLGAIASLSQRSGGSASLPGPALDDALADLAADVEVSTGPLAFSLEFGCLSRDAPRVLPIVSELARAPLFPEDRVAAAKAQVLSSLAHADDDAGDVARRVLLESLYGADSVYVRRPTPETAASVTRSDVAAFHARWQRPDAAVLGVVGDFEAAEMRALVERAFGAWKPAEGEPAKPPELPTSRPPSLPATAAAAAAAAAPGNDQQQQQQQPPVVLLIDRPGLSQATVAAGEPGVDVSDRDTPSLDVLSSALNSFGGALFDSVRSRDALAYSVSASWDSPADHRGVFLASADTSRPGELLLELRRALNGVVEPPRSSSGGAVLSPEAIARAREQALEQYAFSLGGSPARMSRALSYDVLGLPQDFSRRYRDRLAAVTPRSVREAAARQLHPDAQLVVVAADGRTAARELEASGFRVVRVSAEGVAEEAAAAPAL